MLELKSLNVVNQQLKRYEDYFFDHVTQKFLSQIDGFFIEYENTSFNFDDFLHFQEPKLLYGVFKNKDLQIEETKNDVTISSVKTEESYVIQKCGRNFLDEFKPQLNTVREILIHGEEILNGESKITLDGELVSESLNVNVLEKIVKKQVNEVSNASILYAEINDNTLNIRSEYSTLDLTNGKVLVLPISIINSTKVLKKDVTFFNVYELGEYVLLEYGVKNKEIFRILMTSVSI